MGEKKKAFLSSGLRVRPLHPSSDRALPSRATVHSPRPAAAATTTSARAGLLMLVAESRARLHSKPRSVVAHRGGRSFEMAVAVDRGGGFG